MLHSPDTVHPRDVENFDPRDRKTILAIDEALGEYALGLAIQNGEEPSEALPSDPSSHLPV